MVSRVLLVGSLLLAGACVAPSPSRAAWRAGLAGEEGADEQVAEKYDPSDPTRIDARAGFGFKYTAYDPGGYLNEMRAKLALQLNPKDLLVADIGVGQNHGVPGQESEFGLTDGRFRYFRLWDIDRSLTGWQGWGTSVEVQTPGTVPGTDGSGLLALGWLGALGLGKGFSCYLNPIVSSVWTRNLDEHLGVAVRGDVFLTYKPGSLWRGAYFKLKPSYSYGVSQTIDGEASGNLEASIGGSFSGAFWWDVQGRKFLEQDLDRFTEGRESGLADDWSLYVSFTYFF